MIPTIINSIIIVSGSALILFIVSKTVDYFFKVFKIKNQFYNVKLTEFLWKIVNIFVWRNK